jgi:hypothetical protein
VEVINAMKQWGRDRVNPWAGHLVDAARYFEYSKESDHWKFLFLTDDVRMKKMLDWYNSPTGKEWSIWGRKIKGIE